MIWLSLYAREKEYFWADTLRVQVMVVDDQSLTGLKVWVHNIEI